MSQYHDLPPNASAPLSQQIIQNHPNIRHGLNGPALIVPNDVHMAQATQHVQQQPRPSKQDKGRTTVLAIPSVTIVGSQTFIGDANSMSERSYTPVKGVGDGSFGTVFLCDWHTPLAPSIALAPMQQGAGARPEWQGKRLVAIKQMKKRWEGGWDECRRHPELESLRSIPPHENVIPLYDCFLLPSSKELYFVFECMEGNLYQLIKSRKGRPLAGGLVSSIFAQTCKGLAHIHDSGYFHRDMKPENLLVTTTGIAEYTNFSPLVPPGSPPERDVIVIIKLADFGLARQIKSKPPYTEYVATRWYRAPEILLQSTDYNAPVDLWAVGTIMAEVVNLKPLFPGTNGPDQLLRICQILGDPSDAYGFDSHGRPVGGGKWSRGLKMAKQNGISFPKIQPQDFFSLFDQSVPQSLVECIYALLRYDPEARLTAHGCLNHAYFVETAQPFAHPTFNAPRRHTSSAGSGNSTSSRHGPLATVSPRSIPPSHSHSAAARHSTHHHTHHHHPYSNGPVNRAPPLPHHGYATNGDLDMTPADGIVEVDRNNQPVRRQYGHHRLPPQPERERERSSMDLSADNTSNPTGKSGMFGLKKLFGHQEKQVSLPPVEEITFASNSTPSLKDTPSTSSESRSLPEVHGIAYANHPIPPPVPLPAPIPPPMDPKKRKKEQERQERDLEMQRRANLQKMQQERARAVVAKRNRLENSRDTDFEFQSVNTARLAQGNGRPKTRKKQDNPPNAFSNEVVPLSVRAANSYGTESVKGGINGSRQQQRGVQVQNSITPLLGAHDYRKRRKDDDELSMSSSDVQSVGRMSVISFATVESDPGSTRVRRRPSAYNYALSPRPLGTATSISSIQSYSNSPRSSHSVEPGMRPNGGSLDAQFTSDFETRATLAAASGNPLYSPALQPPHSHRQSASPTGHPDVVDSMSPPNMQFLTLAGSPSHPPWTLESGGNSPVAEVGSVDGNSVSTLGSRRLPSSMHGANPGHHSTPSYEYFTYTRSHPPTPHSGINPMFQVAPPVPPLPATSHIASGQSLPPLSSLLSVIDMQTHPTDSIHQQQPLGQPP